MIQLIKKHFLYFTVLCFLFVCGCSCSEDPKPDRCMLSKPVTAKFTVGKPVLFKGLYNTPILFDSDTILDFGFQRYVFFTANQDSVAGTEYTWEIGADTYKQKAILINFGNLENGGDNNIPVKLTIKAPTNKTCFATDTCCSTTTRTIVWLHEDSTRVRGVYFGYRNGNPFDTATLAWNINRNCGGSGCNPYLIKYRFYKEDKQIWYRASIPSIMGYKFIGDNEGSRCMFLYPNNNVINFYYHTTEGVKYFIGKRVN